MEYQNIKDLRSSSSTARTEIPDRLRENKDLRYILIKKKEKKPFEDFWTYDKLEEAIADWEARKAAWEKKEKRGRLPKKPRWITNYSTTDSRLAEHLARGGNYGIKAGYRGLAIFDSDVEDRLQELGVFEKLPPTFRIRTGSGGFHRYFYIPDLYGKIVLFDKTLKHKKNPDEALHLGEIQWRGTQVVGPGSTHPNGKKYEVVDDLPIATITKVQLLDAISCCKLTKKDRKSAPRTAKEKKSKTSKSRPSSAIGDSILIQDIAMPDNPRERNGKNGREIFGSHPIHGSKNGHEGKNFHINIDNNTWYCYHCESGGGSLEWIAVKSKLIGCPEAGQGCLRGKLFRQVLEIARGLGYEIPDQKQSRGQMDLIENRIIVDKLPEDLPTESPVIVVKGPPRIGKTYWATKQLIKAREGNYITHRHSIVKHAIEAFRKEGGQYAVWLEGKHRKGMCWKERPNCSDCEFCPHDKYSYMELKGTASGLLFRHKILTKEQVPSDLCPYYVLKLAEESANYCFTVVNFIDDIQQRSLTVLDEDPTLAYFYPSSVELFRFKTVKYEYKMDNTLGKALEQASSIRNAISEKERPREEDKALLWAIDTLGGINEPINITMSSKSDPEKCYHEMARELDTKECSFSSDTKEKALKKLDQYQRIDQSSKDIKDYIGAILYLYKKRPVHLISSGGSGYRSVYLIGDASSPVINMHWTDTSQASSQKILIIGNTLAELFGKSLGNAVVLEIREFKYRKNFVVLPIDSGGEDSCRGEVKKQRIKVKKIIKAVAGDPDSKTRQPIMALVGSKEHQDWLMRSLGGIARASQEEGEIGQQWNYRGGYVNIIYQNSVVSRGLDVDQYNVMCVQSTDFIQPFWAAAREVGEENAEAILNSNQMDETTNSVLRISPIMGGSELRPKVVIIPREDLWKVRYLDEQILGEQQGGRTPDIDNIARVILENNLTGTSTLVGDDITIDSTLSKPGWEEAVKEGKLVEYFKLELDRMKAKGNFTEQELKDAMDRILKVLMKVGKGKGLSVSGMRYNGLKCKNELISPALNMLHYQGNIKNIGKNRKFKWALVEQNVV